MNRTIRMTSIFAVLAGFAAPACAHDEILVALDEHGHLHVHKAIIEPLLLDQDFADIPGIAGVPAGLTTILADEPGEGLFVLPPSAEIVFILTSVGHGLTMFNGLTPMNPGDSFYLGFPYFHLHPVWSISDHHAGETILLHGFFRDLSGAHADSEVFSVAFTTVPPPPCEGDYSGDDHVNFVDVTHVLANWGNPFTFTDITIILTHWGADCGHGHD